MYFLYFEISPYKRMWSFIWKNSKILHPRMLCAKVWLILAQLFWRRRFYITSMYFRYFVIISLWRRAWIFIWTYLNFFSPKAALRQVWLKLVIWVWRRRYLNLISQWIFAVSLFRYYLPFVNGVIHLKKLQFPSHNDALCQI